MENYRGITLMDTGYKIYAEILRKRLEEEVEGKREIEDTQFGFRKGRGTIDAINVLKTAIGREIYKEKEKCMVVFADMKAAFDRVKREEIWRRLKKAGVSEQLRARIEGIYRRTYDRVKIKNKDNGRI